MTNNVQPFILADFFIFTAAQCTENISLQYRTTTNRLWPTSQIPLLSLQWGFQNRNHVSDHWVNRCGHVDELCSVSRCLGSAETPPWWRWSRRKECCVGKSKLGSGLRRTSVNRTACPSCPAGRGGSRRRIQLRPPLLLANQPRCSGTPPSEQHDGVDRPRPPHWQLVHDFKNRCFFFCQFSQLLLDSCQSNTESIKFNWTPPH